MIAGITGRFAQGSLTAIVGPNGGGKSTLLKGLLGLLPSQSGSIESRHARRDMAYLAQASEVDASFPVTVEDFVSVGLWTKTGGLRAVTPSLAQRVSAALEAVGLQDYASRWMDELSGGQFQRTRFARLLVQDAAVVLLDEPFAGIDEETTRALMRLIVDWHAQGKTVIAVLHGLDLVRAHFPQTLALAGRMVAWDETTTALAALAGARPAA
ncbi:MAG: ATP-binding cassette domain-containing protein [Acidovorax sp.]